MSAIDNNQTYNALLGSEIPHDLMKSCVLLFSMNYGVWGEQAGTIPGSLKPGQQVKMTSSRLQDQCVCVPEKTVLVTCLDLNKQLVGHAFASVWEFNGGVVGWITQLVVDASVRKRHIATQLLRTLKGHQLFQNVTAVGLVSSHPAACGALSRCADANIYNVDHTAQKILSASPISYLKGAELVGSIFVEGDKSDSESGAVSSAFTKFYVDHKEPLEVLDSFEAKGAWCLGELLEGHEYLALFPVAPLISVAAS